MRFGQLCSEKGNVFYQREAVPPGENTTIRQSNNIRTNNQLEIKFSSYFIFFYFFQEDSAKIQPSGLYKSYLLSYQTSDAVKLGNIQFKLPLCLYRVFIEHPYWLFRHASVSRNYPCKLVGVGFPISGQ